MILYQGSRPSGFRQDVYTIFMFSLYVQCKSTDGCCNELVVAIFRTGAGVKVKKSITVGLYILVISLHLFLFVMTPGAQTIGNFAVYGSAKKLVI